MAYKEAVLMSQLNHPNVMYLYECFIADRILCLVMEYAMGGTLHEFLREKDGKLLSQVVSTRNYALLADTILVLCDSMTYIPVHHSCFLK
jgi:serine/threonine protein kinase